MANTLTINNNAFLGSWIISSTSSVSFYVPEVLVDNIFNEKECTIIKKQIDSLEPTWANVFVRLGPKYTKWGLMNPNHFDRSFLNNKDYFSFIWQVDGRVLQKTDPARFYDSKAFDVALCCIVPAQKSCKIKLIVTNESEPDSYEWELNLQEKRVPKSVVFTIPNDALLDEFNKFKADTPEYLKNHSNLIGLYNTTLDYFEVNPINLIDSLVFYHEYASKVDSNKLSSFTFDQSVEVFLYSIMDVIVKKTKPEQITITNTFLELKTSIEPKFTKDSICIYEVSKQVCKDLSIEEIFKASQLQKKPNWITKVNFAYTGGLGQKVVLFDLNTPDTHQIVGMIIGSTYLPETYAEKLPLKIYVRFLDYKNNHPASAPLCNNKALLDYYNATQDLDSKTAKNIDYIWINNKRYDVISYETSPFYAFARLLYMSIYDYGNRLIIPRNLWSILDYYKNSTTLNFSRNKDVYDKLRLFTIAKSVLKPWTDEITREFGVREDDDFITIFNTINKKLKTNITVIYPEKALTSKSDKILFIANPCFYSDTEYDTAIVVPSEVFIAHEGLYYMIGGDLGVLLESTENQTVLPMVLNEAIGFATNAQEDVTDLDDVLNSSMLWNNIKFSASVWRRQFSEVVSCTLPLFELCKPDILNDLFINPITWFTNSNNLLNNKPLFIKWNNRKPLMDIPISEYNTSTKNEIFGKAVLLGYFQVLQEDVIFEKSDFISTTERNTNELVKSHSQVMFEPIDKKATSNYVGLYSCVFNVGDTVLQNESKVLETFSGNLKNNKTVLVDPVPLTKRLLQPNTNAIKKEYSTNAIFDINKECNNEYNALEQIVLNYNKGKKLFEQKQQEFSSQGYFTTIFNAIRMTATENPSSLPENSQFLNDDKKNEILKDIQVFNDSYKDYISTLKLFPTLE